MAETKRLIVYNPTGSFEMTQTFAPRLTDLNGKTICMICYPHWQYERIFPLVMSLLQEKFPEAKIMGYENFPILSNVKDIGNLEEALKAAGCQAAIVGIAG